MEELKELTEQEKLFALYYANTLDSKESALKAGYSISAAKTKAYQWVVKDSKRYKPHLHQHILGLIEAKSKKLEKKLERSGEEVIKRLWEVTDRTMQKKPVMVYNPSTKEYDQATTVIEDEETGELKEVGVWTFDAKGANTSLGLLGKHYGVIKEKVEVDLTSHDESVKRIREKIALRKQQQPK